MQTHRDPASDKMEREINAQEPGYTTEVDADNAHRHKCNKSFSCKGGNTKVHHIQAEQQKVCLAHLVLTELTQLCKHGS